MEVSRAEFACARVADDEVFAGGKINEFDDGIGAQLLPIPHCLCGLPRREKFPAVQQLTETQHKTEPASDSFDDVPDSVQAGRTGTSNPTRSRVSGTNSDPDALRASPAAAGGPRFLYPAYTGVCTAVGGSRTWA